jgi:hypothetical protein
MRISKKCLRKKDRIRRERIKPKPKETKTAGINEPEIQRQKEAGECLHCAWPSDRKGIHRVKDCVRPIKLDNGTAGYPKAKEYKKLRVLQQQQELEEPSHQESDLGSSSNSLL